MPSVGLPAQGCSIGGEDMTVNGPVTIWHYDEESEEYTPTVYTQAHTYTETRTAASDGGFVYGNTCRVRIPTNEDIDISTDDYIYIGAAQGGINKGESLKVVGFSDNRKCTTPHWRIDAV